MGKQRAMARWSLVLGVLRVLAAPAHAASGGTQYYVALGTSLVVGIQPDAYGMNQRTHEGYADQLSRLLRLTRPRLQLVKLGCPGTGCEFCQSFEPLEVVGEKGDMRGQGVRSARAKKHSDHAHARPALCHGVARIFLTAPLSYAAVALHLGQCEQLLRYVKLATSSM